MEHNGLPVNFLTAFSAKSAKSAVDGVSVHIVLIICTRATSTHVSRITGPFVHASHSRTRIKLRTLPIIPQSRIGFQQNGQPHPSVSFIRRISTHVSRITGPFVHASHSRTISTSMIIGRSMCTWRFIAV